MRMSAKAEYAVRAMIQLASADEGAVVKTDDLAKAQGIPPQFLVDILSDLRTDRLVHSRRGREGGYELARPRSASPTYCGASTARWPASAISGSVTCRTPDRPPR